MPTEKKVSACNAGPAGLPPVCSLSWELAAFHSAPCAAWVGGLVRGEGGWAGSGEGAGCLCTTVR